MSDCAVVFADRDPQACRWYCVADGQAKQSGEGLAHLSQSAEFERLVVLLPGSMTGSRLVEISGRNTKENRAEALFSVEEAIGTEIESVHGALGSADAQGKRPLIWIGHQDMEEILRLVRENGLQADRVIPDYLALPQAEAGTPVMTRMGDRVLLRHRGIGAVCPVDMVEVSLEAVMEALFGQQGAIDPFEDIRNPESKAHKMAVEAADELATDTLLQGTFAVRGHGFSRTRRPAFGFAVCVCCSALLFAGLNRVEGRAFKAETVRLRASTELALQKAFPDIGQISNPRAQLQARLQNRNGAKDFLRLSVLLRDSLQSISGIALVSIRFDASEQGLQAQIRFSQYADLARLRQRIEAAGGQIAEKGSSQAEEGRIGDIVVTAK